MHSLASDRGEATAPTWTWPSDTVRNLFRKRNRPPRDPNDNHALPAPGKTPRRSERTLTYQRGKNTFREKERAFLTPLQGAPKILQRSTTILHNTGTLKWKKIQNETPITKR